jgi:VWFA-related protein
MRHLLFLIPAILLAMPQQPLEPTPAPANLVSLNVVALDAKGQSVTDLSTADFRIWDNGKPQTIASFRRRESRPSPLAPLGPRQYSNRSPAAIHHATVILFDLMNMQFQDRGYVFNQLFHSLQEFESTENLYLYLITVNGRLYPVHGLPGNEDTAAKDADGGRDIPSKLNQAMQATFGQRPFDLYNDIDARVRTTFATLSMVAARLAAVPGRKNIVWLTHGVPISLSPNRTLTGEWVDYSPFVQQLSNTLDHADVSIYAVQESPPGSINNAAPDMGRSAGGSSGRGGLAGGGDDPSPFAGMGSEETLNDFAKLTGGRAYQNNDIVGAIKQAMHDVKESYLITYAPPWENWDGKFHKIRITCARKGVRLQARQGYFAFADQASMGKEAQDAIEAAIQSPLDAAEIGLRATAARLPGEAPVLRLAVRIDLADVRLTQTGEVYTGQLSARFIEYQDDGTMRQTKPASLNLRLSREERDTAMKEGYAVAEDLAISPQVQRIRVIVFDNGSTEIGSLSIPLGK